MRGLPGGVVTFLFSDIEGSTRLVKALRDRYPQVLAEHRRLVRAAIAGRGGQEVDAQGDAFFVAFAGAKQAVLCALEIQRALASHDWPAGAPVRVRIGIHTGYAVPAEGVYTGLAVHRAARICAAARGGQVLVSQATRTIIDDEEEEPGFTLVDLGERTLKDLDRPVRLYQVAAPGLYTPAVPTAGHRADKIEHDMLAAPRTAVPGASAAAGRALPGYIGSVAETDVIRAPDQRVWVFVSSALQELAAERRAVREAVTRLRLVPVMFEPAAGLHPARPVYRAYLAQSQVFVGIYWQSYGWVAPGEQVSGLEDEYRLSAGLPRLIYVKSPAPDRQPRLTEMLARIRDEGGVSFQQFSGPAQLGRLVQDDLAVLLSQRSETVRSAASAEDEAPLAGMVPVPVTPLVGREREAAAVEDLVVREGARLVTLTGAGGVGKSRLVVEAARRLGSGFADGARFVELTAVPEADLVAPAVAAGLGLTSSAGRLIADLQAFLRTRRLLLVLDNFEHVIGASALLAGLLAAAPGVVLLVTSRVVLRLRGEHEFPVPPLPVPPAGMGQDAGDVQDYASVGLFTQRARAAAPGFKLDGENAEAVAEICRRLDGLPLAIELAAARVRLLSPQALLARLGQRFSVLTGGARDLPERQRTLRNTLDWSFGLLSAGEQALLARLGVFAGPFGLPAAEAVGGLAGDAVPDPGHAGPVMDTLGSLVDSSLVRLETRGGEPRFALLETVREYALEHLAGGGDWAEAHDRHAAYFVALAEPAAAELQGRGQLAWLDRLESEHDNVRAAMSWLVDHGAIEQAIRLLSLTWRFWWLHGHAAEFARLGDQIVANSEYLPPYQRALALTGTGFMLIANGDQVRAQALFEQSLPLYRPVTGKLGVVLTAAVLGMLGRLATLRGEYSGAAELLDQSQALLRELDDDDFAGYARVQYLLFRAMVENFLGEVRLSQGDHDGAARQFTDGLTVGRRTQDRISILPSLYYLALSSQAQGDLAGAAGYLKEGLALAAEAGDEPSAAYYLEGLAAVAGRQDDPQRAVRLFGAARSLLEARGSGWLHAFVPRVSHDDAVLAALRSRMGDAAAFEAAQAWGGSVRSTRAMQYALE
jgi:predicted ATPase/class 3 adenylate cyclase